MNHPFNIPIRAIIAIGFVFLAGGISLYAIYAAFDSRAEEKVKNVTQKYTQVEKENVVLRQELDKTQQELGKVREDNRWLSRYSSNLTTIVKAKDQRLRTVEGQLKTVEANVVTLRGQVDRYSQSVTVMGKKIKTLQAERNQLMTAMERLTRDKEFATGKNTQLMAEVDRYRQKMEVLNTRIGELETMQTGVESQKADVNAKLAKQENTLKTLEKGATEPAISVKAFGALTGELPAEGRADYLILNLTQNPQFDKETKKVFIGFVMQNNEKQQAMKIEVILRDPQNGTQFLYDEDISVNRGAFPLAIAVTGIDSTGTRDTNGTPIEVTAMPSGKYTYTIKWTPESTKETQTLTGTFTIGNA